MNLEINGITRIQPCGDGKVCGTFSSNIGDLTFQARLDPCEILMLKTRAGQTIKKFSTTEIKNELNKVVDEELLSHDIDFFSDGKKTVFAGTIGNALVSNIAGYINDKITNNIIVDIAVPPGSLPSDNRVKKIIKNEYEKVEEAEVEDLLARDSNGILELSGTSEGKRFYAFYQRGTLSFENGLMHPLSLVKKLYNTAETIHSRTLSSIDEFFVDSDSSSKTYFHGYSGQKPFSGYFEKDTGKIILDSEFLAIRESIRFELLKMIQKQERKNIDYEIS